MAANISTKIGSLSLERPTILASGILGISLDVFNRIYNAGAGAVVTKSLSKEPWDGYANPTIFSVKGGGWLNAVGLSNPGAENFAKMIEPNKDVPIIVSLVGSIEDDFEFLQIFNIHGIHSSTVGCSYHNIVPGMNDQIANKG